MKIVVIFICIIIISTALIFLSAFPKTPTLSKKKISSSPSISEVARQEAAYTFDCPLKRVKFLVKLDLIFTYKLDVCGEETWFRCVEEEAGYLQCLPQQIKPETY